MFGIYIIYSCFVFTSIALSSTMEGICPTVIPCICKSDGILACSYQRMDTLPQFLEFHETRTTLDLSQNFLSTLPDNGFQRVRVKYIQLEHNTIKDIHPAAFNGLSTVEILDLSHNRIITIPDRVFSPMIQLTVLKLQYNDITKLGEWSMSSIPNLQELDLTGNNIDHVPNIALCKIGKLKKLILRGNKLRVLEAYSFVGLKLEYLDIGFNTSPFSIHAEAFCGLEPRVISSKPGVTDWKGLTSLLLDHNGLTTLNPCITQRIWTLTRLDISGNPLHCDCHLLQLKDYGVKISSLGGQCATPDQYAGQQLRSIDRGSYICPSYPGNDSNSCQTYLCRATPDMECLAGSSAHSLTPYCAVYCWLLLTLLVV